MPTESQHRFQSPKPHDQANASVSNIHKRFSPRRKRLLWGTGILIVWLIGVMIYHTHKPLPAGLSYESPIYRVNDVAFWHDLSYLDTIGTEQHESEILPRMLQIIEEIGRAHV